MNAAIYSLLELSESSNQARVSDNESQTLHDSEASNIKLCGFSVVFGILDNFLANEPAARIRCTIQGVGEHMPTRGERQ